MAGRELTEWRAKLADKDSVLVKVKPRSAKSEILHFDEQLNILTVRVAAPPVDGKANDELVKFLKKELQREVLLKSGASSKLKLFQLS